MAVDGTVAVWGLPDVTETTDPDAVGGTEMRTRAW